MPWKQHQALIGKEETVTKIGVLALQGAFIEHTCIIQQLGASPLLVRLPNQLKDLDGLIIPGGESSTLLKLMHSFDLFNVLRELVLDGLPVWGTCAGLICLGQTSSRHDESTLAVMDINVKRNAFGRQTESFETDLDIPVLGDSLFKAIFIRAPAITKAGPMVEVLAKLHDGTITAARQENMLATAFHPELTGDFRFHQYFIREVVIKKD